MIIKRVFIILVCVCLSHLLFAQQKTIHMVDSIVYDVDDIPVYKMIGENAEDWFWDAPIYDKASGNIEFNGGEKVFKQLTDSLHSSRWNEYNYNEINSRVLYVILFDDSLKIIAVRVLQKPYTNSEYNFTQLLKWILYSTEGKWKKMDKTDTNRYFFYLGAYRFR